MTQISSYSCGRAKGCRPSEGGSRPDRAHIATHLDMADDGSSSAQDEATASDGNGGAMQVQVRSNACNTTLSISAAKGKAEMPSDLGGENQFGRLADGAVGVAPGGYGGQRGGEAGRVWNARGTPAQTQGKFRVGDRVVNASGRGVWGFGSIVGIIPPGVNAWWWCRRHGLPAMFRGRSCPMWRERYIVLGDDGMYHAPRRVRGGVS